MIAAKRPLTIIEIETAFATSSAVDRSTLPVREDVQVYNDIFSACSSILYIPNASEGDNATLNFCHQSVKDFLLGDWPRANKHWYYTTVDEANLLIFQICWRYLSSDEFANGSLVIRHENDLLIKARVHDLKDHFQEHPFMEYACNEWDDHAIASYPALLNPEGLKINVVNAPALRDAWLLRTAREGQTKVLELLRGKGANLNVADDYGWTPLFWAAANGHEAIVKLLLDIGKVDADLKDDYGQTPLSWAAENGHEAIVKLLLDTGKVDADLKNNSGQTPLSWAAGNGHEAIVKLLLDTGKVDADLKDNYGHTPL
jgi:ankyrin repeat protein